MENSYIAEKDIELEFPKIPKYSKSIIEGKKLELKNFGDTFTKLEFSDGSVYTIWENLLILPNGEKYEGLLSNDKSRLTKGKYIWPNNQTYYGAFDEQNRFFTNEGELSELIFSNGDIFRGEFKDGIITEGTFITEGEEITANFAGGKVNGLIEYKDTKKGVTFYGNLLNGKKEGVCKTEVKIKDKLYSIKGEYSNGLKDGTAIIREVSPNKDNLYIKGKYKEGERNGYFDIIDKQKNINITHKYISNLQNKFINQYNEKYNENINGKEISISITFRNNPINQLQDLVLIRFSSLLTLDLTRSNINSISFLCTDESTLFSLQNLILSYNNISDIEPLVDVDYKKLKILKANDNKIKDINCVKEFDFKELEELNLSNNPIKSIEGIQFWKFPNLFKLSFYRTNISDDIPLYEADFPNLTNLDLSFTKISKNKKPKPEMLKKCKNLKNITFD